MPESHDDVPRMTPPARSASAGHTYSDVVGATFHAFASVPSKKIPRSDWEPDAEICVTYRSGTDSSTRLA